MPIDPPRAITIRSLEFVRVSCPLCGRTRSLPLWSHRNDRFIADARIRHRLCLRCGSAYQSPRPNKATLARMYERAYHAGHTDPARVEIKERQARERARWLLSRLEKPETAFEIGCGEGALLRELADAGVAVSGVEPGAHYASYGRERYGVHIEVGEFPEVSRRADLVVAVHVIEHIPDPGSFLRSIHEALTPDGVCFIETPNLRKLKPGRISANLLAAPHLIVFTPASLRLALGAAGLTPDHMVVGLNMRVLARAGSSRADERTFPLAAYKLWRHRRAG